MKTKTLKKGCKTCGTKLYRYTQDVGTYLCTGCYDFGEIRLSESFKESEQLARNATWVSKWSKHKEFKNG